MQKTLGGDRLGSGNKQKVHLHGYERSTHDLGYLWRSTMSAGTLVPFMKIVALPGDTFDINLGCEINTHPTIGPLFGSFKVQLDVFTCPVRLYQAQLHNNKLKIGMNMSAVKLPQIKYKIPLIDAPADLDNAQINPSSILKYLGLSGFGVPSENEQPRQFNAVPFLAYWDIYKNYYANKQEEIGAVIHQEAPADNNNVDTITIDVTTLPEAPTATNIFLGGTTPIKIEIDYTGAQDITQVLVNTSNGTQPISSLVTGFTDDGSKYTGWWFPSIGEINVFNWKYATANDIPATPPKVTTFPLENLDDMRELILADVASATPFIIDSGSPIPYKWPLDNVNSFPNILNTQEGLAIKTYQSDLFNNWLNTEWIDGTGGISEVTAIDTTGGSFTIDQLALSEKVWQMLNRIAVSGGTYNDWIEVQYDHQLYVRSEIPMYMGGLSKELVFQEVISNSESSSGENGNQPLGTLAGKGTLAKKHKGGRVTIKCNEISYIIGIVSLTPRIDYSQGNDWDTHLQTMDDFHKPALDEIGFQELIQEQMAWWTTVNLAGVWTQKSAGKQPAWINYMTAVNKTFGNFAIAGNEMFMTLNRRYEGEDSDILDLTTYIDPVKYNQIFAQTSLDAQNFWVQIAADVTARRKMSARIMPNL